MKIEKLLVWGILIAVVYYIVQSMRKNNGNGTEAVLVDAPDQEGLPESRRFIVSNPVKECNCYDSRIGWYTSDCPCPQGTVTGGR